MNVIRIVILLLMTFPAALKADAQDLSLDLYGQIDISRDHVKKGVNQWNSNISRIGVKGESVITDRLSVIYQLEQEVDLVRGGTHVDTLFGMRNTFIGVKGPLGRVMFGAYDTPLKRVQGDVDLFNDQLADIKDLFVGEVRARDAYTYHSPALAQGYQVQVMYVPSDGDFDASYSASIGYENGSWAFGIGVDADMRKNERPSVNTRVYDSVRASAQYSWEQWQLGFLVQNSEQTNSLNASDEFGYMASVAYRTGDIRLLAQYAESDIIVAGACQISMGVDYWIKNNIKMYGIASHVEAVGSSSSVGASIGIEIRF